MRDNSNVAFKKIGVIFLSRTLMTKTGKAYFSGKTEDAEDGQFNLMAYLNTAKSGKKYLSVVEVVHTPDGKAIGQAVGNELTINESVPTDDDLPF